jgi:hypothetical protein
MPQILHIGPQLRLSLVLDLTKLMVNRIRKFRLKAVVEHRLMRSFGEPTAVVMVIHN